MVKSILGVSHQGFTQWLFQRITALIMLFYTFGMLAFVIKHPDLTYVDWYNLFSQFWMKVATLLVLSGLLYHTWIGMWTVFTDYIKCSVLSLALQVLVLLALVSCFFAGLLTIWGA